MSSTTSKKSKANALAQVQALIAGTQKHFPSGSLTIGNTAYTLASIVQTLQGLADVFARVDAAHTSVKDLVAEQRATESKVAPFLRDYTKFLRGMFGTGAVLLADFGLQPPKARMPLTVEQRAAAKAKAKATRAARGTTSKKQRMPAHCLTFSGPLANSCDKPLGTLKRDDDAEAQRAAGHAPLAQSPDERTRQY